MTKLKEKMMQWSRYTKIIEKTSIVFFILFIFVIVATFLFEEYNRIIAIGQLLCIMIGIFYVFSQMLKSFEDQNKEFIEKNSFWNIVLSYKGVIESLLLVLFIISALLYYYVSDIFLVLEIIILITYFSAVKKIADFFEKRLIE